MPRRFLRLRYVRQFTRLGRRRRGGITGPIHPFRIGPKGGEGWALSGYGGASEKKTASAKLLHYC
eukprot:741383-Ditylum_brightwellii.AAC.1